VTTGASDRRDGEKLTVRVAIRDVAQHAGVSRASVSNFLNRPELLSDATRARIAAAVSELGFVPNDAARQLRSGRNAVIGYVAFEVSNAYFGAVADAIERAAQDAKHTVMIGNSLGSAQREQEYLEVFERQRVGGVIVAPLGDIEEVLAHMRRRGMPSVITGRLAASPDQPSVSVDDLEGGRLATRHLLDIGRRRITFVGGPLNIQQIANRFRGAIEAVRDVPGATLEMVAVEERTVAEGRKVGAMLLNRDPNQRPDGIFAANDPLAMGILQAFGMDGDVAIPDDIAIIGYDDSDFDQSAFVPLSSIRTPHEAIGAAAVRLLLEARTTRAEGDALHLVFKPELVPRASTESRSVPVTDASPAASNDRHRISGSVAQPVADD
jgi:LacI family transcriptional regulator